MNENAIDLKSESSKEKSFSILLALYIFLFPILPSYFRIFGYSAYTLLTLCVTIILFFLSKNSFHSMRFDKKILTVVMFIIILRVIPLIVHFELARILLYIADDCLPIFLLFVFLKTTRDFNKSIEIILLACAFLCLFGVIEYFTHFNVFSLVENYHYLNVSFGSTSATRAGIYRIEESFNTAITYCIYLSFCLWLCFYKIINGSKEKGVFLLVILINLNAFLTVSRGALILMILGEIIFFGYLIKKSTAFKLVRISIIIVLVFMIIYALGFHEIIEVFKIISSVFGFSTDSTYMAEDTLSYRLSLFGIVFNKSSNNLFFGLGIEQRSGFTFYSVMNNISGTFDSIDNHYLGFFLKYGIVGLASFLFTYFGALLYAFNRKKRLLYYDIISFNKVFVIGIIVYLANLANVAQMADARISYIYIGLMLAYNKIIIKSNENTLENNKLFL